jgi:hypothetical protein
MQFDEQRKKNFPQLKEAGPKDTNEDLLKRMELRFRVPKENNRQSYRKSKTEIRPLFSRLTPQGALEARSPLVSMIFPSLGDKKKIFQEEGSKKDISTSNTGGNANSTYVKRTELEKIVEMETKRRNPGEF